MIKSTTPLLALLGLGVGVWAVINSAKPPPDLPADRPPPEPRTATGAAAPGRRPAPAGLPGAG
jgi:hypothetical protein